MQEHKQPSRRAFLNVMLGGAGIIATASVAYPIARYLIPPKTVQPGIGTIDVTKADKVKPNSGMIFRIGSKPGILIRTPLPGAELRAFSAVCTHLGCTVQYRPDLQHIWCACHNGHYDLFGRNISGPPPRPLPRYDVTVRENEVFVSIKKD